METKVCNKCKYLMNENSQFCENCGTKYETVLSKVENLQIKQNCISCKKEFSSESIFCPHCGIKNSLLNVDVIKTTKDKDIDNETKEKKVTNNNDVILFGIAVFLFVVLFFFYKSQNKVDIVPDKTPNKTESVPPKKIVQQPSIQLKVTWNKKFSGSNWEKFVYVQVLNQELSISKITVNRGSCQILDQSFLVNRNLLKYGDTLTYFLFDFPECNILEVEVFTNLGNRTYYFD